MSALVQLRYAITSGCYTSSGVPARVAIGPCVCPICMAPVIYACQTGGHFGPLLSFVQGAAKDWLEPNPPDFR